VIIDSNHRSVSPTPSGSAISGSAPSSAVITATGGRHARSDGTSILSDACTLSKNRIGQVNFFSRTGPGSRRIVGTAAQASTGYLEANVSRDIHLDELAETRARVPFTSQSSSSKHREPAPISTTCTCSSSEPRNAENAGPNLKRDQSACWLFRTKAIPQIVFSEIRRRSSAKVSFVTLTVGSIISTKCSCQSCIIL
jgi:hypothetical protein